MIESFCSSASIFIIKCIIDKILESMLNAVLALRKSSRDSQEMLWDGCASGLRLFLGIFIITKTRLFKYIENFTSKTEKKKSDKTLIFFLLLLKT